MFGIFFIVLLVLGRENADENGQNEKISIELLRRDAQMFLRILRRGLNGNPHAHCHVFREHIPVDYSYAANLPERALPTSDEYIRFVSKCPFWTDSSNTDQYWVQTHRDNYYPPSELSCPGQVEFLGCWVAARDPMRPHHKICFKPSLCSARHPFIIYRLRDGNYLRPERDEEL